MGEYSQKTFTSDKLHKFAASGNGGNAGERDRDRAANSDDFGRAAAKTSDSSAFASGGAAKGPSLGRAGRAGGGRVARALGGQATAKDEYTQAGRTMANEDASGKDRFTGGDYPPSRAKGGRVARAEGGKIRDITKVKDGGVWRYGEEPLVRQDGGRVDRARGGRAKGKGKTVVNVIVGHGQGQQPPAPAPQAAIGPVPPAAPPPPPPRPPMQGPPGAAGPIGAAGPPGAPMGPAGAPPGGIPPQLMGRARGGRISEKFGANSGPGRLEKTKRENSGKVMLAE